MCRIYVCDNNFFSKFMSWMIYFLAATLMIKLCKMKNSWQRLINGYRNTLSQHFDVFSVMVFTLLYLTDGFWLLHTLTAHFNLFFLLRRTKNAFPTASWSVGSSPASWSAAIVVKFRKLNGAFTSGNLHAQTWSARYFWGASFGCHCNIMWTR